MLVLTGASRPEALAVGLQVAPAQLNVVVRPRCCDCWASTSIPATHGPDCQLKPPCPPKLMPLSVPGVLVASSGVPMAASVNPVLALDLPQPWPTLPRDRARPSSMLRASAPCKGTTPCPPKARPGRVSREGRHKWRAAALG